MQTAKRSQNKTTGVPKDLPIQLLTTRVQAADGVERDECVLRYKINGEALGLIRECPIGALDHEGRTIIERAVSEITECKRWTCLLRDAEYFESPAIAEANRCIKIQERKLRELAAKAGLKPHENSLLRNHLDLNTGPFKTDFDAVVLLSKFSLASKILSTLLSERIVAAVRDILEFATDDEHVSPYKSLWLNYGERLLCESLAKLQWVPANVATFEARVAELRRIVEEGDKQ